ncbi:unnamed protein product [Knipowitschia caucasica]
MEKYFKPVRCPSELDKSKQHFTHHRQEHRADRFVTSDYTEKEDSQEQCYEQHGHFHQNNIYPDAHTGHQTKHFSHCEDESDYDHSRPQVSRSRISSSSLSSSSSSSSTSWYTEASATDTFSHRHAERPQHSLSCSNIHDARRLYQLDNATDPIVFATVKHGSNASVCGEVHRASNKGKPLFAPLDRGHSQSDDGFLQNNERKKSNLNRSLGFSEEDIMLGVSNGPKRTISSCQLPSKGILKNREQSPDIRKAKSMEVLSPRIAKEQSLSGKKAKSPDIEQAKHMFVQQKIKFSAFLDEITKQVISPSDLKILGVNANQTTNLEIMNYTLDAPKPQLPPKKQRDISMEVNEQIHKNRHVKAASGSLKQQSDSGQSDTFSSYSMNHSSPSHSSHHKNSNKYRRPPSSEGYGRYGRSSLQQTDGTSTSPEPHQPRHRYKTQPTARNLPQHEQHRARGLPLSSHGSGTGLGSESSSTKSDSSRTRDTVSTATSSEQSGFYHSQHASQSEHRGTQCETDHLLALQEENTDLQQNLLQTVVCIENLEAELQRTREELAHVKDKYKSLLESHSGTQQANHLLQDHLHSEAQTLSSERQHMFARVAQLSAELEEAHKTIAALENINVPSLMKELLEKHLFCSAGPRKQSVSTTTPFGHLNSFPRAEDVQLHAPKLDLPKPEPGSQRPTAFSPVTHGLTAPENQSGISGSIIPCPLQFCAADISAVFSNNIPAGLETGAPVCEQALATTTADAQLPSVQPTTATSDKCSGQEKVKLVLDEPAVTAMSAQQILNEFVLQLWAQKEADQDKEA